VSAGILDLVLASPQVRDLPQRLEQGAILSLSGISPGALPLLAVAWHRLLPDHTLLIIVDGLKTQEQFEQDLTTWLRLGDELETTDLGRGRGLFFYPSWEILPHESRLPHADVLSDRLAVLTMLQAPAACPRPIIVASVPALMQRTFTREQMDLRTRRLQRGDHLDPLDLIEWLEDQGYEPEAQVTQKGELALRGGILDVYPLTSPWPLRLEFFGNDLESLRYFDPVTQLSREIVDSVVLSPGGEFAMLKHQVESARGQAALEFSTLADHLPAKTLVLFCEPQKLALAAQQYEQQIPPGHPLFANWEVIGGRLQAAGFSLVAAQEGFETEPWFASLDSFCADAVPVPDRPVAETRRQDFFRQLQRWLRQSYAVHVFGNNEGELQRFAELWRETEGSLAVGGAEAAGTAPVLTQGALSRGFIFEAGKLVVVTDAEVFGRYKVLRPRRMRLARAAAAGVSQEISFAELKDGDYVVHIQYGIGIFRGLQVLPTPSLRSAGEGGLKEQPDREECLVIEYAPRDREQPAPKLYVPVTEAHLVSKYVGAGKTRPPLSVMGSARWIQAKAQAEQAVRDLASELLAIQASRSSQAGHSFAADTIWQHEFEGAFLYEETADQLRAIQDAKRDLETTRPMDRLICGDVGFGKTEVALRAAFKVVMGGKQVAMLVPTTVLAQQHFNTFSERMADYPVRIELLSRFRSQRDQARVIRELANGSVDILIGTHRLLQDDIQFKDLGLVVIDEEQRFGVLHKEKLKRLRHLVDVLTLSATPIPRTLYLALTGARDMSTLETPPQDRLPVETHVMPFDERVIRDAVRRELNRQGQVFYLHNRVQSIDGVGARLQALVPEARLAIGHGQMKSHQLEAVMSRFVNGEIDVLVSTTIIESGLDIPNANTIIIDRADRFGLSDLYQLRGRVGRYKHQAYAYFLLPRHATLLADARKRITAIKQYSSPGSGFKIALRDLEIRGAGNLLGTEQSGHIAAVGFELYCQLLKQSISSLKGLPVKPRVQVELRLDFIRSDPVDILPVGEPVSQARVPRKPSSDPIAVPREVALVYTADDPPELADPFHDDQVPPAPAALPMAYVTDTQQRISLYRKLASVTTSAELEQLRIEITDRFGPLPLAVDLLLQLVGLKLLATDKEITSIETRGAKLMLTRRGQYVMLQDRFPRLTKKTAAGRLREIFRLVRSF
jgi:transcription-repair coupling factor (superfamily II helicase)